jgi:hypothetical protein
VYYHQFQPNPILGQSVQYYWTLRTDARTPSTPDHGVIPGGYADLVFNVGDQVCLSDSGSIFVAKARSFVVGPFDRFRRFRAECTGSA